MLKSLPERRKKKEKVTTGKSKRYLRIKSGGFLPSLWRADSVSSYQPARLSQPLPHWIYLLRPGSFLHQGNGEGPF